MTSFQEMTPPHWPSFPALVARRAATHPDKPAVLQGEQVMTYAELARQAAGVAHLLQDMGVKPGDRVGCMLRKTPEAVAMYVGAMAAGAVFAPLDCNQPAAVLQQLLQRLRLAAVAVSASRMDSMEALLQPGLPLLAMPDQDAAGPFPPASPCCRFWAELDGTNLPMPAASDDYETPIYLNFTSGSTGQPKGALTTLGNIHWNTLASVQHFRMTADDIHLCMMPAFVHPHELFARPLALGGTIVLVEGVRPKAIAAAIRRHQVTCFMAVGAIYETLVRQHERAPFSLPSLRVPESGGMHVPATLVREFHTHFGVPIQPVWGSTETTGIALASPLPGDAAMPPGAMGQPLPQYHVDIVDEHGEPVPQGQVGEMRVRGPGVCREYFAQPEESAESFTVGDDGYARFRTKDLVSRAPDGSIIFHSRLQGMLKVAGMKVYPTRIEELLHQHPDVAQAVVVRMQDALRGESPRAIVTLRSGCKTSSSALRHWLEPRLHRFAMPRVIDIVEHIPKTPGGKIAWNEL